MDQLVVDVEELTLEKLRQVWEYLLSDERFPEAKAASLLRMNVQLNDSEFKRVTSEPVQWMKSRHAFLPRLKTFWQPEGLSFEHQELLALVLAAHDVSARRENASTVAAVQATLSSGSYTNGIAAALMTLGGVHGPIVQTFEFLVNRPRTQVAYSIAYPSRSSRVPGWGNSFVKGEDDPAWVKVKSWFLKHRADWWNTRVEATTKEFHAAGKLIFPNPACYTAATALTLGIPASIAPFIFIQGRLAAWTEIIQANIEH